jgi:hypothetical protein
VVRLGSLQPPLSADRLIITLFALSPTFCFLPLPHDYLSLGLAHRSITLAMVETAQRVVPGAPPPTPLSKSQKKKRKAKKTGDAEELTIPDSASAALIEKAPEPVDVQEGAVAPELVAKVEPPSTTPEEEISYKPSPIVELINKRLKATAKKIVLPVLFSFIEFIY